MSKVDEPESVVDEVYATQAQVAKVDAAPADTLAVIEPTPKLKRAALAVLLIQHLSKWVYILIVCAWT